MSGTETALLSGGIATGLSLFGANQARSDANRRNNDIVRQQQFLQSQQRSILSQQDLLEDRLLANFGIASESAVAALRLYQQQLGEREAVLKNQQRAQTRKIVGASTVDSAIGGATGGITGRDVLVAARTQGAENEKIIELNTRLQAEAARQQTENQLAGLATQLTGSLLDLDIAANNQFYGMQGQINNLSSGFVSPGRAELSGAISGFSSGLGLGGSLGSFGSTFGGGGGGGGGGFNPFSFFDGIPGT